MESYHTKLLVSRFAIFLITCLIAQLNFPIQSSAQASGDIIIYSDSTAQEIRGFGAANIVGWRPDMTEETVEAAYGTDIGQLGLSILRIRIPPDENQWESNLTTAQKAYNMGAKVIASPWSPPAEMKMNNELVGGRLRPDAYQDYANHLNRFADYMEENGVPLYGISIQNEPDIEVNYESCDWTPQEMIAFLSEHGQSIGPRIIAPESFQFRRAMSDPILNDPRAAANFDILGGHIYGGGNSRYILAEQKDKEIWMTEYLMNLGTGNSGAEPWSTYSEEEIWNETLLMLGSIQQSMKNNWNAYIWWYLQRYYSFIGDGSEQTQDGEILKRGYAFSHFSRFVRPGFSRVHTTVPFDLEFLEFTTTAYKDSSQLVIVTVNGNSKDRESTFVIENKHPQQVRQYRTDLNQNSVQHGDIETDGNRFTVNVPAKSIVTFIVDELQPVSNEIDETVSQPETVQLSQNYPNPFNPSTSIHFRLMMRENVRVSVFDVTGREVNVLTDRMLPAGNHTVQFDASNLSSGIYIYRLQAGDIIQTRKMLLVK